MKIFILKILYTYLILITCLEIFLARYNKVGGLSYDCTNNRVLSYTNYNNLINLKDYN